MDAELSDAQMDQIWVEIEVQEDDDGLNCYSGLAEKKQLDQIVNGGGECSLRFLHLEHVFWTRTVKESEWAPESRRVIEYGKGRWGNHKGSMYFRCDNIILISELHGGAELQRRYVNEK